MSNLDLAEVFDLIVKFLQRPIVQRQLIAFILAVGVGAVLARLLRVGSGRFYKRYLLGERWSSHGRRYRRFWRGERELMIDAAGPVVIISLLALADYFFVSSRWPSGVLRDAMTLVAVVLGVRLLVSLLGWIFGKRKVKPYRTKLIGPATVLFVILSVISWFVPPRQLANIVLFNSFEGPVTTGALFLVTVGFYFVLQLLWAAQRIIIGIAKRVTGVNQGALDAGLTIIRYILIGGFALAAANLLQLNTTTIAAVTGGLALGAGLALQGILSNFIGGVVVLFEGSVRPGDWIEVDGSPAKVEKLSIRSTVVRRPNNSQVIVPNQDWLNEKLITYTRTDRSAAILVPFTIPHEADMNFVRSLVMQALDANPNISREPPASVAFKGFSEQGYNMSIWCWVPDFETRIGALNSIYQALYDIFQANNIQMEADLEISFTEGPPWRPALTVQPDARTESVRLETSGAIKSIGEGI